MYNLYGFITDIHALSNFFSNSWASHDNLEILLLMACGICLMIDGGWLDCELMYSRGLSSFLYTRYFPLERLRN